MVWSDKYFTEVLNLHIKGGLGGLFNLLTFFDISAYIENQVTV